LRSAFPKFLLSPIVEASRVSGKMPFLGFDQERRSASVMRFGRLLTGLIPGVDVHPDFSLDHAQGANEAGAFSGY
jgi:hypothetical protein